ncbi:hypothetical protein QYF36_010168 [Acer negundo]|nr:hypothetical protein QYF36_010168 [Acer negundo]
MLDVFMFFAQSEQGKSEALKEKPPDPNFSVKLSRMLEEDGNLRKPVNDSFKSRLLSMSMLRNWSGFGAGVETSKQATETRKKAGKSTSDRSSKIGLSSTKGVKVGFKKMRGSRFEILNEGLDIEFDWELAQNQFGDQGKPNIRKGLVEISNTGNFNRKQLNSLTN